VFRVGADLAVRRGGKGIDRLAANLRRVVPDMSEALLRDAVRSYSRYWMEAFRLPSRSHKEIVATFTLENDHLLRAALAEGRGAIVALPHAGNWDHAGAWACLTGMPLTTVAERLKPEELFRKFVAYRESLGMEIIPMTGGQRPAIDVLADRLREGRLVVLLADRDLSARGVPVTFFGERAKMPPGPALLALRTGAPLFVAALWYDEISRCRVDGPLPLPPAGERVERVAELTQSIADHLAAGIAEHPRDWHMLQKVWVPEDARRTTRSA
jgi:KDO2-lipid IV(A) lauroyltransferase